jgi:hypothetical protein
MGAVSECRCAERADPWARGLWALGYEGRIWLQEDWRGMTSDWNMVVFWVPTMAIAIWCRISRSWVIAKTREREKNTFVFWRR